MKRGVVLPMALALLMSACATTRDTIEAREAGTSRVVTASFDSTWEAMLSVVQHYPGHGNKAEGTQITDWEEELVDPQVFAERGILKRRTRFEINIAVREGGSRVAVRRSIQLLAPVFLDPVSPGPRAFCQYPPWEVWPSPQSIVYPTYVCVLENPWEEPRGAPIYVWQDFSQVRNAPATLSGPSEQEILDAIEAAAQRADATPSSASN